jgi:hypothetical protein
VVRMIEIHQGSIYNPGWEVAEQIGERHWRVRATFEERADAQEFLSYLTAEES